MSRRGSKDSGLVLGSSPRVNLLPPEVANRKRDASIRRAVVFGVIGAVLISAAGYGLGSFQSLQSAAKLDAARDETTRLIAAQGEFAEVRTLAQQKETIGDALIVGASTEIDWKTYHEQILATLPTGVTLTSFVVDSASPIDSLPAASGPTQGARDAMFTFVASAPSFASIDVWLKALESLPGYVDATASGVTTDEVGVSTANVVLNLSSGAYSNRYAPEGTTAETEATTDTTETTDTTDTTEEVAPESTDGTTTEDEGTN